MFSIPPLGFALLAVAASVFLVRRRRRLHYPPGPKGYPVVGNVFDIPQGVPLWTAAMSMGVKYGEWVKNLQHVFVGADHLVSPASDMVYLNIFGADNVVLNSNEAISDLLDKRSAIYSDRVRTLI